ncbi:hypothetical protein F5Y07DRAFT_392420 [Xylaria sp. FL0933]|nr:hypothetical protein F5Y07DRAFT_392420 [Xylaria sp. FL0933]
MEFSPDTIVSPTDEDLDRVFAYCPAPASVITFLRSKGEIVEEKCTTEQDWNALIEKKLPSISSANVDSGFVLLVTPRNSGLKNPKPPVAQDDDDEKGPQVTCGTAVFDNIESLGYGGKRYTRVLPFSTNTFSRISKAFYIHRSICPTINRADIPLFSHEEFLVQGKICKVKARVYNCRSTNAWGSDLAMTVTHFPHCRLTFGILFGCTKPQRKYVLERLTLSTQESDHPLLLPGLFAELEKKRHHVIFEAGMDELESMISDTDMVAMLCQRQSGNNSNEQGKQAVYLNMLHLKHGLTAWSQQLAKMLDHAFTLNYEYNGSWNQSRSRANGESSGSSAISVNPLPEDSLYHQNPFNSKKCICVQSSPEIMAFKDSEPVREETENNQPSMAKTNLKVIKRVSVILEDYNDKIRECQTRFDGLTMTTQMSQGEASVALALITSQDSRHMKTIALVTMLFLPGTFFATIFSMTFFNWQAGDGESPVSSLLWIYIVFSAVSTAITLMVYYYFVALRTKKGSNSPTSV